jgi:Arc/MetJ-type ribon-helix-helix transcriptional regulator
MPSSQQFNITLPDETATAVRAKVATGEYASESELFDEGVRVLLARDQAVDDWLATEVVTACRELAADPADVLTAEQVRAMIAAEQHRAASRT